MTTALADRQAKLVDLVRAQQAGLWRYLRYLGCEPGEAEDLVQDTFLVVFRDGFEERSATATTAYLRKVARHRFLLHRRTKHKQGMIAPVDAADLELAEEYWVEVARNDGLDAYLDALRQCLEVVTNARVRRALEMQYVDDASRKAIAEALELTVEGVKTLLRRAKTVLRDCIQRRLGP